MRHGLDIVAQIREELELARTEPMSERELAGMGAVSMNDVARTFEHDLPIARDARGWYVFRKDLGAGDDTPVFWCEQTGERTGYAPNFEAFLFRNMIEMIVDPLYTGSR